MFEDLMLMFLYVFVKFGMKGQQKHGNDCELALWLLFRSIIWGVLRMIIWGNFGKKYK